MFMFEIKKIIKRKYILILIIFSILVSFCAHLYNQQIKQPIFEEEYLSADEIIFDSNPFINLINLNSKENKHLTDKEKFELETKSGSVSGNISKYFVINSNNKLVFNHDRKSEYNRTYNYNILKYEELINKYNVKMTKENQQRWEWRLYSANYRLETNTYPMDYSGMGFEFPNIVRKLIFNQPILFGMPLLIVLIVLFSSIISKEKEEGTWDLLRTQPVNKSKIILSKYISMFIVVVLYSILTMIFTSIFSIISGIGFENGLFDLYKIFNGNFLSYYKGYQVLVLYLLAYLIFFLFIGSLILLISSKAKDTKSTIAISIIIFLGLYFITCEFGFLKSVFNPVYAINFSDIILGGIKSVFDQDTNSYINILVNAKGIQFYIYYLFLSFVFFILTLFNLNSKTLKIKEIKNKTYELSPLKFEKYKIIRSNDFKLYTIVTLLVLFMIFIKFIQIDKNVQISNQSLDPTAELIISDQKKRLEEFINNREYIIEEYDKKYGDGKDIYMSELSSMKSFLNKQINESNGKKLEKQYYINNDSNNYYQSIIDRYKKTFDQYSSISTKSGNYSNLTFIEGLALFEYMKENKIRPVAKQWIINQSEYEEISDQFKHLDAKKIQMANSHSSLYSLYRLFTSYRLDLVLIFLLLLIVMGGFTFDKENGNHLSFLFTEPISRNKYYLYKLFSAIIISGFLTLGIFVLFIILGWITEGFGPINYPIILYDKVVNTYNSVITNQLNYFRIIPIYEYIIRLFSTLIAQIIFISSLSIFISIFVDEKIKVFVTTSMILVLGMFIVEFIPKGINSFIPFNHLNATNIANGSIILHNNMPNNNIFISIVVLIFWSLIITFFGRLIVNKKDYV